MANTAQARRYAQAIFGIAEQTRQFESWLSDLNALSRIQEETILIRNLETPNLSSEDKVALLRSRFPQLGSLATNLVSLLVQRGKIQLLPSIFEAYQRLMDIRQGIERAEVATAVPMGDEDVRKLESSLSSIMGKKVIIKARVDPSVIGGVVARFEGKLLDGSTRSKLESLKRRIAGAA